MGKISAKLQKFAAVAGLIFCSGATFGQLLTKSERNEQKEHMPWVQQTLARIGHDQVGDPPADVLLTYAPTDQATARARKNEKSQRDWVVKSLKRIRAIQPGAPRSKLLSIFIADGGLSTPTHQTFVYRTCPYIKVDVDFRLADPPHRHHGPAVKGDEQPKDVITRISPPYLAYMVTD